jgi:hypothetical protein
MKFYARSACFLGMVVIAYTLAERLDVNAQNSSQPMHRPVLQQPWTQLAGEPNLGDLTTDKQQPVDFGIWQAADGTWQLWSCVRNTKEPGNTRLFYRWEGAKLTDANWKPMGIAMHADTTLGETQGGLQAPYVFREGALFNLFYGDWNHICRATSSDGKNFTRVHQADGKSGMFGVPGTNTRDPMVLKSGDTYYCYYAAYPDHKCSVFCRTSKDLTTWSVAKQVAFGGQAGENAYSAECPFVVELAPGEFHLFRTQDYSKPQTSVYFSHDPLDFGVNHDEGHFVCTLPVAAPEIFKFEGNYYIAALLPSIKGIRLARLDWAATP